MGLEPTTLPMTIGMLQPADLINKISSELSEPFVEKMGLEPTTPCMPCKCSSQLSYIPELFKNSAGDLPEIHPDALAS